MREPPWGAEEFTDPGVPTMISAEERRYLHWLTRAAWTDAGHVLELGPWLGGSTICLAAGMRARGSPARHRIHAVDDFRWRPFMASRAALPLRAGDSFEPHFRANLRPWRDLVHVRVASLPDEVIPDDPESAAQRGPAGGTREIFGWPASEPIEILFVDGAKSWKGLRHLLRSVRESLLPGRSLLAFQDFKYWGCYWVPMIVGRLAPLLEPLHDVVRGNTVTFRLREPLGAEAIDSIPPDVHAADPVAALADLERAARALQGAGDPRAAHGLALARVKFLAHRGDLDAACSELERAQAAWPLFARTEQLDRALRYLRETRGRPVKDRLALRVARRIARAGTGRSRVLMPSTESELSIRAIRPARAAEWDSIFSRCEHATGFQSRAWAEVWLEYSRGRIQPDPRLVEFSDGSAALLPISVEPGRLGIGGRQLLAPGGTYGGWLAEDALDKRHAALLFGYLTLLPGLSWRVNPHDPLLGGLAVGVGRSDQTQALRLDGGFDAVLRGFSRSHRRAARKAEREGVTVHAAGALDEWKAYYEIYRLAVARWGERATSSYRWELFAALFQQRSAGLQLWLARHRGEVVAGALVLCANGCAAYWHGAARPDPERVHPVHLLLREILRDTCERRGSVFDFNPSGGHAGVEAFKRGFGAAALPCPLIRTPPRSLRALVRSALGGARSGR